MGRFGPAALILLAVQLGCRQEVCTTNPSTLPVSRGTDDEAELLDGVWQGFAQAVAPDELCLTQTEVWSVNEWRVEGRYRSVRRNIWVGRDDPEQMATALRHELCHAYDKQVLSGRPPSDSFSIDVRLGGSHPGKLPAREAFAWACSLEPTLVPSYAAAACEDDDSDDSLAFLASEVYVGQATPPVFDVPRLEFDDPSLRQRPPLARVEPFAEVPGALGLFLHFEDSADAAELVWLYLADGRLRSLPPPGPVGLLIYAPAGSLPSTSTLSVPFYTAASNTTEVALVETVLLSGSVQRALVRRDGEIWGSAPAACGIPLDAHSTFFLADRGRMLLSVSVLDNNRLVLVGWDGELPRT